MPIQYSDPTYAALTVETAKRVGEQKTLEREADRRQQMDLAAMEVKSRRELAQFEADMRLQAAKLGQAWELEKMQRESELDFQFEQQKLTLARSAVIQKQAMAKEQYLSYVDHVNSDKSLTDDERGSFKRMAYDQMVAGMDTADRVYFPEAYQEGGLSNFGSMTTTPGAAPTLGVSKEGNEVASAVQQAMLTNPGASDEEIASAAEGIARSTLVDRITQQLVAQHGGKVDEQTIAAEANKMADIELQAQQGYQKSKSMGYKSDPFSLVKSVVQKGGLWGAAFQTKQVAPGLVDSVRVAARADAQADKARRAAGDNAVDSIIKEWFNPSTATKERWEQEVEDYPRTSSLLKHLRVLRHKRAKTAAAKKPAKEAQRQNVKKVLTQTFSLQGGYKDRSQMMRQGFPGLYGE